MPTFSRTGMVYHGQHDDFDYDFKTPETNQEPTDVYRANLKDFVNTSFDDEDDTEQDDMQGVIRTVPGARLIYKRKGSDETYEELWIYNIGNSGDGVMRAQDIRRAILAGTDIPASKMSSSDGTQRANTWAVGNAEVLNIVGLVN